MNNVLLVGNGFDLAHGLLTKYEHFLYLMKNWDEFYSAFMMEKQKKEEVRQKEKEEEAYFIQEVFGGVSFEKTIDKYTSNASNMDKAFIDKLGNIIKNNSWAYYFCNCEAEIDGWIDFEKEIYPVMELFEHVFKSNYYTLGHGGEYIEAIIEREYFTPQMLRTISLWTKYFGAGAGNSISVRYPYVSLKYGILKKKILENLRREFDEFINAFEIYLYEFVYKNDDVKPLKQIKELGINNVISFNYTLTEKLYGIAEEDVHHLHGMIREDITQGKNNMVMGVSESAEQNIDFIYYVKYFQRLRKASGVKYKELLKKRTQDGYMIHTDYILYIYGHSLDVTNEDILKYVIGDKDEDGKIHMMPKRVVVFYYDDEDYEQKMINLIRLYGRDIVEDYMERNRFEFVETSKEISEV